MTTRPRRSHSRSGSRPIGAILAGAFVVALVLALALWQSRASGNRAPDFPLEVYAGEAILGGNEITLHQVLEQGKPVVLNFWAGLCPPCRAEMPGFQRLYDAYGDKFILLGVDVGPYMGLGTTQDALAFLEEFDITYPTGRSVTHTPLQEYGVLGMPTTVFIKGDGAVLKTHVGLLTEQAAEDELRKLLQASGVSA